MGCKPTLFDGFAIKESYAFSLYGLVKKVRIYLATLWISEESKNIIFYLMD